MTPVESSEAVPLLPGTRFGPYEISAQIGVGGMGEVYRATDTNLSRQVAIKVLPEAVASNADTPRPIRSRSQDTRVAEPSNIAAIYGVEKARGTTALVMELVDGPTLADRIVQGAVPVDEALQIARQIAEALEAAHAQGIVHRDLKPANIKLRRDGTVKVLDFGLAKVADGDPEQARSQMPTVAGGVTREGQIVGTAAYMSPEQARGLPVDKRTDIWAFGCVLFEIADRPRRVRRRYGDRYARRGPAARAGLECASAIDTGEDSRAPATLPAEGSGPAPARHRRRAHRDRGVTGRACPAARDGASVEAAVIVGGGRGRRRWNRHCNRPAVAVVGPSETPQHGRARLRQSGGERGVRALPAVSSRAERRRTRAAGARACTGAGSALRGSAQLSRAQLRHPDAERL